jgi:hypothetical protein
MGATSHREDAAMIRTCACVLLSLVLGVSAGTPLAHAQAPPDAGGAGTVIAVDAQGMATVKVGEKQQTVSLPDAKVGDPVECKDYAGKWKCTVKDK